MVLSLRGSGRARLVWLGMLAYMLYNFAYYVFSTAFNSLFLVYVAILDLSVLALLFALVRLDVEEIGRRFRPATPARWIAGFMAFVAVGLTVFYAATSLTFVVSGQIPEIVTLTGNLTSIVFALDLSLVVPWFVLAAIWLWQRRPWGHVLAVILNVKSAVYMLALSAATVSGARAGVTDDLSQVGLWGFIGVGSLITSLFLLGNLKPADR
jgi:glucan phosphoethanolaminetransferase (alkaline phosphatase superfamily)